MFRRALTLGLAAVLAVLALGAIFTIVQTMPSPANAAEPALEAGRSLKIGVGQVFTPTATVNPTVTAQPTVVRMPLATLTPTVTITPTANTPVPTFTPTPVPQTSDPCLLDKVATAYELDNGGRHRIEIGGHTIQHGDYYPAQGVPAISYIIPAFPNPFGIPGIWWGHISIWQAPETVSCASYDWESDTEGYARARLDSGHSGLVVDLRGPTPVIITNVGSLTSQEAQELLELHMQSWGDATNGGLPSTSCDFGQLVQRIPEVGVPWEIDPDGLWIILIGWTNEPGANQAEWKLLLSPSDPIVALLAGGSSWSWPEGCESTVRDQFDSNPLPELTLQDLESMGLLVPNGP